MYKNLAAALAAACFLSPAFSQTGGTAAAPAAAAAPRVAPLKVGFVYVTPVLEVGWTRQHDAGRRAVGAGLGTSVETSRIENAWCASWPPLATA